MKENDDLSFLEKIEPKLDNFKHSGLAFRKLKETGKQQETNSIAKPPKKIGFGTTIESEKMAANIEKTSEARLHKSQSINYFDKQHLDMRKMDPRKAADFYIKKVSSEYHNEKYRNDRNPVQSDNIQRELVRNLTSAQESERMNSPNTSMEKENAFMDFAKSLGNGEGGTQKSRISSVKQIHSTGVVQTKETGSSNNYKKQSSHSSTKEGHQIPSEERIKRKAESFARLQSARRGLQPFDFKLPSETMIELRCILHPTIQRSWKCESDSWFPGMRQYYNTLKPKNINAVERKMKAQQHFKSEKQKYIIKDVEEARSKPIVRCSSNYMDPDRLDRQLQLEKDKNIIAKRTVYDPVYKKDKVTNVPFQTLFPKTELDQKDVFMNANQEYRPVSSHQFRERKKKDWVSQTDFKLF